MSDTYVQSDAVCSSEIDYILFSKNGASGVSTVEVLSDYMNVSDHLPVLAKLGIEKAIVNEEHRTISIKPKWEKCNVTGLSIWTSCVQWVILPQCLRQQQRWAFQGIETE